MKVDRYEVPKNIKDLLNWEHPNIKEKFKELVSEDDTREFAEKVEQIKLEDCDLERCKRDLVNCFKTELFVISVVEELNQLLRGCQEMTRKIDSIHFSQKPTFESFAKQLIMNKLPRFPNQL
jgi:hypothetical protein